MYIYVRIYIHVQICLSRQRKIYIYTYAHTLHTVGPRVGDEQRDRNNRKCIINVCNMYDAYIFIYIYIHK